jgi:PAS domain S-box-containing protein
LSYSKDVSEVNKVKKENQQLSKRLRAMFDQHAAIKIIFDVKTEQILSVNPSACDFYGYTETEFLKLRLSDINELWIDEFYKNYNNKGRGNTLLSSVPQTLKNGEKRLLDVYCSPIWDGSEHIHYVIAYDVTDRENLRQKLIHEEELLRITLQSIGDGVIAMNEQGNITSFNDEAAKLLGGKVKRF